MPIVGGCEATGDGPCTCGGTSRQLLSPVCWLPADLHRLSRRSRNLRRKSRSSSTAPFAIRSGHASTGAHVTARDVPELYRRSTHQRRHAGARRSFVAGPARRARRIPYRAKAWEREARSPDVARGRRRFLRTPLRITAGAGIWRIGGFKPSPASAPPSSRSSK
jgi:hypothetical protein